MSFPLAASLSLHHCVCVLGFHEIITWTLASCPGPWAVSLTNWDAGIPCVASNTLASKKVWNSQIEFERNQRFKHGPNERERYEPSLCWICDLGLCARFGKKNHLNDQRHGSKEVCKTLCNNAVLPIQKINALCEMKLTYQMCFACFARCRKKLASLQMIGKQWQAMNELLWLHVLYSYCNMKKNNMCLQFCSSALQLFASTPGHSMAKRAASGGGARSSTKSARKTPAEHPWADRILKEIRQASTFQAFGVFCFQRHQHHHVCNHRTYRRQSKGYEMDWMDMAAGPLTLPTVTIHWHSTWLTRIEHFTIPCKHGWMKYCQVACKIWLDSKCLFLT